MSSPDYEAVLRELDDARAHIQTLKDACRIGLGYVEATEHSLQHTQPNIVTKDANLIRRALAGKAK